MNNYVVASYALGYFMIQGFMAYCFAELVKLRKLEREVAP